MFYVKFLLFLLALSPLCASYKILAIFTIPTNSHNILASKLFTELAKNGHEVTFITPYVPKQPVKNLKIIPVEGLKDILNGGRTPSVVDMEKNFLHEKFHYITQMQYQFSKYVLSCENVQKLLNSNERFDAVIVYQYLNEALLGLAHHFKVPVILFKSMPLYVPESFLLSHPNPSSYVPNIMNEFTGRMNFWQRLQNSLVDIYMILYYQWAMLPKHKELVKTYIPGKPDLYSFLNNASLVLVNSHVSTNVPLPLVPNVVEIGGFHIEQPKNLSADLKQYLDESHNGVILFSMGSICRSADFPKETREAIIKSFAKFEQNVLWKFEEDLDDLPKNIKTMKWVPQSDVLAHPNVKAFISHGGLLSTMESVYHAVPIIGIPIFVDQKMNTALAKSHGYALELPYRELNEEKLTQALEQILKNSSYKEKAGKYSKIMRDRPVHPLDSALYWINYTIQHEGAHHLRYPGMDLNWFQRNLLDVAAFVLCTLVIVITILLKLVKVCCCRRFVNKTKKE